MRSILHYVAVSAEAATVIAIGVLCAVDSYAPAARWFIRSVQVAFLLGYSVLCASTIYILIG